MTAHTDLKARLTAALGEALTSDPPPCADDLTAIALDAVFDSGWHHEDSCPPCLDEHCDHTGDTTELSEAVRMLHSQAHNAPDDTFTAERCHREPCRSIHLDAGDARIAFTPGSRVA